MTTNLFINLDRKNDPLWIVKEFFETQNNTTFIITLNYLANREGIASEYAGCLFPENINVDEEPFEGVSCWYFDDEVIVSEEDFHDCLVMACQRYIQLNPTQKEEINQIIAKIGK